MMRNFLYELTDQQLLDASFNDESRAFGVIFSRHFKRVYAFANSLLKDTETAEELAMDVMERLWNKRGVITAENGLLPYLFTSTRNAVISHLRKNHLLTEPLENLFEEFQGVEPPADTQLNLQELEAQYQTLLAALPEQRRKIFILSRDEGLTYPEIAERLHLSTNTVRNQMSAALRFFRKQLEIQGSGFQALFIAFLLCS